MTLTPAFLEVDLDLDVDGQPPLHDRGLLDAGYREWLRTAMWSDVLTEVGADLMHRLSTYPYYAVLRGVAFDPGNLVFAALACHIGRPILPYPNPEFTVLRTLRPDTSSTSASFGVLTEHLHTDSTHWPVPNDITIMLCQQPDEDSSGTSIVLPLDDACDTLRTEDGLARSCVDQLRTQLLPWAVDPRLGGGTVRVAALSDDGIRWQVFRVHEAMTRDGAALSHETYAFIQDVDRALAASQRRHELLLARNDLLVFNNRRVLHGRGPVANPADSRRTMLHCKLMFHRKPSRR